MRLYDLNAELESLRAAIDFSPVEGEIPPNVDERLAALDLAAPKTVEEACKLIRILDTDAEDRRKEASRLQKSAQRAEKGADRLRGLLAQYLRLTGQDSVNAGIFRVRLGNSPPHAVFAGDLAKLPERFVRVKLELNAREILDADRRHEVLPEGVAVERSQRVVIS